MATVVENFSAICYGDVRMLISLGYDSSEISGLKVVGKRCISFMKAAYQSVVKKIKLPGRIKFLFLSRLFLIVLGVSFLNDSFSQSISYTWDGSTSTAWNDATNWTSVGGTFPGNGGAGDIVSIPNVTNQPVLSSTLPNSIGSLTFAGTTNAAMSLTITGVTLTVTGNVTVNSVNNSRTVTLTGTGTLSCASFIVGSTIVPSANRTLTLAYTLATLNATSGITVNILRNTSNSSVTFTHTSGTITTPGYTITYTGANNAGCTSTYTMGASSPRINLTGATPFTIPANGTKNFTFTGAGAIVDYQSASNLTFLTPPNLNTYNNLIISGGGGNIKTAAANMSVAGTLTVRAASTLAMGTFTLGTPTSIVLETIGGGNGASITGTTGLITLGGGITVNYTGTGSISTGASITKTLSLANAVRVITVNDDGNASTTDFTISNIISSTGTTGGITKAGNGTLALTGANTFDGAVTINAGVLAANTLANAAAASSLGDGAGTPAITIGASGTLRYTGSGHSTTRAITLSGSGATIDASGSGTATFGGAMSGGGFNLVLTGTGTGIYSAIIGTTGGSVTKNGSGTWTLSGANSYTGGCTMNAGTLNINSVSALGDVTGTFTIAGGIIQNTSVGAITTNNHPINLIGDFEHAGTQNLNLGTGAVSMTTDIEINTSVSGRVLTIGGAIDEAGFSLTKSGLGTLNFVSQTISLNALTISAGTLLATSGTMNIHGVFTNNATFSNNVGTVVMNGVGSSIAGTAITFNDLIIAATPTAQSQYNTSFTVADVLTINGGVTFAPTGGTITMSTASSSIVNSGTTTFSGLTIATTPTLQSQYNTSFGVSGALTINGGVTFAPTGGTITMTAAGSSIANTGTKTFNNLTIAATPTAQSQYNTSFSVAGALTINGSVTFAPTGGTITMSAAGSSIANSGTTTFQNLIVAVTPTAQSQYNTSFSVAAALTINGGVTFAPTGGTITMSAVGSSIANTGTKTFNNLTIAATPTAQSQYNTSFSVAGALTINGSVTFAPTGGTITMSAVGSSISNSGTTTFQNLIINATPTAQSQYNTSFSVAAALTISGGVTFAPTGGTITMSAVGSSIANTGTKTFNNLTIAATPTAQSQYNTSFSVDGILTVSGGVTFAPTGGTITMSDAASSISNGGTTTFQNLTIAATPTAQSQYNTSYNVAGALTINGSVTFAPTGGTITMNNAASSISNSGTLTFNNLTVSVTPTSQAQYNTSFSVGGTFATSGAITFAPTGGTITMSGASGAINNPSGTLTFSSLNITGTTISSTGNFAVAGTMTVSTIFAPSATSIISGAGTLTGNGTVNVTRTAATPSFGAQYTITNKTLTNLTVNYNGAGAQTVDAQNYGNLTISTNGTRTVTFINGGTIRVSGVFTPTATTTTYVVTNNTFEYNGSGAQTVTAFTYHDLILSNTGAKTLLAGTTVNCQTLEINDTAVLTLPDTSVLNVQG
jgi:fibronectin-binding autotransporter adhesin